MSPNWALFVVRESYKQFPRHVLHGNPTRALICRPAARTRIGSSEPQHHHQGEDTIGLLEAAKLDYRILELDQEKAHQQLTEAIAVAKKTQSVTVVLVRKDSFGKYVPKHELTSNLTLSRRDAIEYVVDKLPANAVVISTTGHISRELNEVREEKGQNHKVDFHMLGSMGHASIIALGVARKQPDKEIFCFDGDGAVIMHEGSLGIIGDLSPENFRHVVFNNGAHDSVGGQPSVGLKINIPDIALASDYKMARSVDSKPAIDQVLKELKATKGPALLEIKVRPGASADLTRPDRSPERIRQDFTEGLRD